jgi:hypothetical protein
VRRIGEAIAGGVPAFALAAQLADPTVRKAEPAVAAERVHFIDVSETAFRNLDLDLVALFAIELARGQFAVAINHRGVFLLSVSAMIASTRTSASSVNPRLKPGRAEPHRPGGACVSKLDVCTGTQTCAATP